MRNAMSQHKNIMVRVGALQQAAEPHVSHAQNIEGSVSETRDSLPRQPSRASETDDWQTLDLVWIWCGPGT